MTYTPLNNSPTLGALDPGPAFAPIPWHTVWMPALDEQVAELARQAAALRLALARW